MMSASTFRSISLSLFGRKPSRDLALRAIKTASLSQNERPDKPGLRTQEHRVPEYSTSSPPLKFATQIDCPLLTDCQN